MAPWAPARLSFRTTHAAGPTLSLLHETRPTANGPREEDAGSRTLRWDSGAGEMVPATASLPLTTAGLRHRTWSWSERQPGGWTLARAR